MKALIRESFENHQTLLSEVIAGLSENIVRAAEMIINSLENGGQLLLCGNGGSAADAQHIAAEFVGRFIRERQPLKAVALTTDSSVLTAIGNDYGFDAVFSRQVEALASPNDVLLAISTSGNSPNVVKALRSAGDRGCGIICLTGNDGGRMKALAQVSLNVLSDQTPRIQEMHILIGHILCDLADHHFASKA